ncbi:hypothetical protein J4474_01990 [Candidatus Pacearchaeota archaeon]|nr:hypothetical protein [Candidatus Pacearchaeota archaeon]
MVGKNKMVKGFVQNNIGIKENESVYDCHKNRLVRISESGELVYGIFKGVEGCTAILQPSITCGPDDKYLIEYERPTQIHLSLNLVRPIPGTLEEWVEKFNKDSKNLKIKKSKRLFE